MIVVEMDSIIFRRNTRKGGRCMRGGVTPLLQNLEKKLQLEETILAKYKTNRNTNKNYKRSIRYGNRNKFLKNKRNKVNRTILNKQTFVNALKKKVSNEKIKANESLVSMPITIAPGPTAFNTYTVKQGTNQVPILHSTLKPITVNRRNVKIEPEQYGPKAPNSLISLISKAEQLSRNLQVAANTARSTIKGGKRRNRRTHRR